MIILMSHPLLLTQVRHSTHQVLLISYGAHVLLIVSQYSWAHYSVKGLASIDRFPKNLIIRTG